MDTNNTWKITRTIDANGERNVSTVGNVTARNARAALSLASRLDGVAKFTGTETHGEFRWGDVCYRATPTRPRVDKAAQKAAQDAQDRAALAVFFPTIRR
jgi:hypothetical protein